jgi:sodium transport system permease protein
MLVVFPAVISMLPGMELNMTMALIPVFNVSQLIKEIFQGAFSLAAFAVTLAANTVYAAIAFYVAVRVFKNEKVLFRV